MRGFWEAIRDGADLQRPVPLERWNMDSDAPPYHPKVIPDKSAKVDRRNIGEQSRGSSQISGFFYVANHPLPVTFSP